MACLLCLFGCFGGSCLTTGWLQVDGGRETACRWRSGDVTKLKKRRRNGMCSAPQPTHLPPYNHPPESPSPHRCTTRDPGPPGGRAPGAHPRRRDRGGRRGGRTPRRRKSLPPGSPSRGSGRCPGAASHGAKRRGHGRAVRCADRKRWRTWSMPEACFVLSLVFVSLRLRSSPRHRKQPCCKVHGGPLQAVTITRCCSSRLLAQVHGFVPAHLRSV